MADGTPVSALTGIGSTTAETLARAGIDTVTDLLSNRQVLREVAHGWEWQAGIDLATLDIAPAAVDDVRADELPLLVLYLVRAGTVIDADGVRHSDRPLDAPSPFDRADRPTAVTDLANVVLLERRNAEWQFGRYPRQQPTAVFELDDMVDSRRISVVTTAADRSEILAEDSQTTFVNATYLDLLLALTSVRALDGTLDCLQFDERGVVVQEPNGTHRGLIASIQLSYGRERLTDAPASALTRRV